MPRPTESRASSFAKDRPDLHSCTFTSRLYIRLVSRFSTLVLRFTPAVASVVSTPTPTTKPTMSDDEDYYEWDDEYLLEDLVPDLVVSNPYCSCRKNIVPGKD